MITFDQAVRWLEEDGHAGCASDLLSATETDRPHAAREAAECAENDPDGYADDAARHLPAQLREWADMAERELA